jgi:hypothetical protein
VNRFVASGPALEPWNSQPSLRAVWRLSKTKVELQVHLERASLPNATETDRASQRTLGNEFVQRLLMDSDGGMNDDLVGAFSSGGAQQVRVAALSEGTDTDVWMTVAGRGRL